MSAIALQANPQLQFAISNAGIGLVIRDNRLVTKEEFNQALRVGPVDPLTGLPFGFQQAFLRGEVQTNTAVRLSETVFSKISDYRSSIGAEIRFQVPVINVPFRIIYAYNPNARVGFVPEVPASSSLKRRASFVSAWVALFNCFVGKPTGRYLASKPGTTRIDAPAPPFNYLRSITRKS